MATYLIDYENVHKNGLTGIKKLTETDTVIVFVGKQIKDVPVDTVHSLLNSAAQIKLKKMKKTAKNYLDFQLATCLGGLVERGDDKEFYIISADSGFEAIIDYWKANKASVVIRQRSAISPATADAEDAADEAPSAADKAAVAVSKAAVGKATGSKAANGKAAGSAAAGNAPTGAAAAVPAAGNKAAGMAGGAAAAGSDKTADSGAGATVLPVIRLDNATKKRIRDIVRAERLSPGQYTGIYNLFIHEKDKQRLYTGLVRLFEQKQGSRLYGMLKDEFEQYMAQ
jgi:hypothetical protein